MKRAERVSRHVLLLGVIAAACAPSSQARAGNEANFVLYDHHTDAKGETEINVFSDFSNAVSGDPRYAAQLFEIERALTDRWEIAVYLEGDKITGEDYDFAGWRLESRYRLFEYGTLLNPVLYVEYENLKTDHKYLLEVTGRTDTPEGPETTKHEIESKLILGQDLTNKLDVAFNWINEANVDTGRWQFGLHWASITRFTERRTKKQRSMSTRRKHASPQAQTGISRRSRLAVSSMAVLVTARWGQRLIPMSLSSTRSSPEDGIQQWPARNGRGAAGRLAQANTACSA